MEESRVSYPTPESDLRVDRLSELPNPLLLEILSSLEMDDVVRTTVLSKRWKDLWTAVPCLVFADASRTFICNALAKWKGTKIFNFSFCFFENEDEDEDFMMDASTVNMLDSWLLCALDKQVEDVYIYLRPRVHPDYAPTQRLYSCSSITKLFLANFNLEIKVNVQWTQLRKLTIDQWSLRGEAVNRILSGSPLLEELVLNLFEFSKSLLIRSTSLKKLHIQWFEYHAYAGLGIQAPNLLTLEISASYFSHNCVLEVPSLTSASLHLEKNVLDVNVKQSSRFQMFHRMFRSICHVEKLTLSAWCTEFLVQLKKKDMVMLFPNVKSLELYARKADEIRQVLEMFPSLMMLKAKLKQELDYALFEEEIHAAMANKSLVIKVTSSK